jgi:dihydropteroate synthase
MQQSPHYDDVVGEVQKFLTERVLACQFAGIDKKRIVLDPGFGFGKSLQHNLALLADLERLNALACPVLVGLSRKRMIGSICGREAPLDRVVGSAAAALIAVQRGAAIVRVHDVAATRDALALWIAVADATPKRAPAPRPTIAWPDEE